MQHVRQKKIARDDRRVRRGGVTRACTWRGELHAALTLTDSAVATTSKDHHAKFFDVPTGPGTTGSGRDWQNLYGESPGAAMAAPSLLRNRPGPALMLRIRGCRRRAAQRENREQRSIARLHAPATHVLVERIGQRGRGSRWRTRPLSADGPPKGTARPSIPPMRTRAQSSPPRWASRRESVRTAHGRRTTEVTVVPPTLGGEFRYVVCFWPGEACALACVSIASVSAKDAAPASASAAAVRGAPAWVSRSNEVAQPLLKARRVRAGVCLALRPGPATTIASPTSARTAVSVSARRCAARSGLQGEARDRGESAGAPGPQDHDRARRRGRSKAACSTRACCCRLTTSARRSSSAIQDLLQDQVARRAAPSALVRLQALHGLEKGSRGYDAGQGAVREERWPTGKLLGPYKAQVEQDLRTRRTTSTASASCSRSTRSAAPTRRWMRWTSSSRTTTHGIRATVMPLARDDFRLPPELYADNLKNVGLDIAPELLIAAPSSRSWKSATRCSDRAAGREGARLRRRPTTAT